LKAISLFSSSGIGDLGIRESGVETVIASELIPERAELFSLNYPNAKMFCGDIWKMKNDIIRHYKTNYNDKLFLLCATPPCQGMSLAGMGKMLNDYRSGKQPKINPKFDERNRLIIPTIDIIKELKPQWVIIENVENMKNTLIYNEKLELQTIPDYIFSRLKDYIGSCEVVNVADYGVPQFRKRLITILTRTAKGKRYFAKHGSFLPQVTHAKDNTPSQMPWVTVRDAIGDLPALDAVKGKSHQQDFHHLHSVPVMDGKKYKWISQAPEGKSAFDNQCSNKDCLYQDNPTHGSKKDIDSGVTTPLNNTPLYCAKCGALLPRPYVVSKGDYRLMKGYISAYKRMWWDEPASTITTRFQFVSSDNNVHPEQNRVLSLYEGTILQTISEYEYNWMINGSEAKLGLIRDTIGESVPPKVIELITNKIVSISNSTPNTPTQRT